MLTGFYGAIRTFSRKLNFQVCCKDFCHLETLNNVLPGKFTTAELECGFRHIRAHLKLVSN